MVDRPRSWPRLVSEMPPPVVRESLHKFPTNMTCQLSCLMLFALFALRSLLFTLRSSLFQQLSVSGHVEAVRALVSRGADVNLPRNVDGASPVMAVLDTLNSEPGPGLAPGPIDVLRSLINDGGASLRATGSQGETALHAAARCVLCRCYGHGSMSVSVSASLSMISQHVCDPVNSRRFSSPLVHNSRMVSCALTGLETARP